MRIKPNESFEEWAERVQMFELGRAKKELARGVSIEEVLDQMGKRINQKLMHPIFTAIREHKEPFDIDASRKAYEESYLKKNSPKPDHLTDD